jgi:hypothetical protein
VAPTSIIAFERLSLISIVVLGIVNTIIQYGVIIEYTPVVEVLALLFLVFVFEIALVLLVSRKRNAISKWVLIVLFLISLPRYINDILNNDVNLPMLTHTIQMAQFAMQVLAFAFLFTPSGRSWVNKGSGMAIIFKRFRTIAGLMPKYSFTLLAVIATPLTFVLNVIQTWQGAAPVPLKLLLNVTVGPFLAAIWPITWMIWAVWAWLGHPTPLSLLG